MKNKNYFLNFFAIILMISLSTKIKAQSFDIFVLDKTSGTTKGLQVLPMQASLMPVGQTMEKKLHMMW
jgi:hypothetical protein